MQDPPADDAVFVSIWLFRGDVQLPYVLFRHPQLVGGEIVVDCGRRTEIMVLAVNLYMENG